MLSIGVNVLLFVLKYWAGVVSGSIAIIADAWHTLSDSLSSLIVVVGGKISRKPADDDHPFGHGRAELISAFVIGIMLMLVAFDFIMESYQALQNHESSRFGTFAIVVTVISIVFKEAMAQYAFWASRKVDSKVLKADGWHHRSDAISSGVILVGIFLGRYYWWVDGVLGVIVALLIGYAAFEILRDTIHTLLGESPSEEILQELIDVCQELYPDNVDPHHFHIHTYGDHTELTFHICLPQGMSIREGHDIASHIEDEILTRYGFYSTIHIEPREDS